MEKEIKFETDFGNIVVGSYDGEIDVYFETEEGDIIDLFMLKEGDKCLSGYAFGDVYDEDPTYKFLITKENIDDALN